MMASLLKGGISMAKAIQTGIRIKGLQTISTQDVFTTITTARIQGVQVTQIIQVQPGAIVVLIVTAISI